MRYLIVLLLAAFSSLQAGTVTTNLLFNSFAPPGCICVGGMNTFTWGDISQPGGSSSSLLFVPNVAVDLGTLVGPVTFTIGTLFVHNGVTFGSEATSVRGDPALATVGFAGITFASDFYTADITNTPNTTGDPVLDSDYYSVSTFGGLRAFGIPEGLTSHVDLMGQLSPTMVMGLSTADIQYSFRVVGFANPGGGGFLLADVPAAAPEANSFFLLLCGMAALALRSWTLRRNGPARP